MGRKKQQQLIENAEFDKQCIWKTEGHQCQSIGHLSSGTLGSGPWYCREHFARLMKWPAWQASVVDESQDAVDERVNAYVSREAGDSEHDWSMRCRVWTMDKLRRGRIFKPMREPGEDETEAPKA